MNENQNPGSLNADSGSSKLSLPALPAHVFFWTITAVGLALDLWTKHAIFHFLAARQIPHFSIVEGFLHLVLRENSGAAFSIAAGKTTLLITASTVALVVVVLVFLFGQIKRKLSQLTMALFTAGILGNLYDRLFNNGYVRDFIDVVYWPGRHWPAFNVADSMLCIAVAMLLVANITSASSQKPPHRQK